MLDVLNGRLNTKNSREHVATGGVVMHNSDCVCTELDDEYTHRVVMLCRYMRSQQQPQQRLQHLLVHCSDPIPASPHPYMSVAVARSGDISVAVMIASMSAAVRESLLLRSECSRACEVCVGDVVAAAAAAPEPTHNSGDKSVVYAPASTSQLLPYRQQQTGTLEHRNCIDTLNEQLHGVDEDEVNSAADPLGRSPTSGVCACRWLNVVACIPMVLVLICGLSGTWCY